MRLLQGDCLELMKDIPDKSVDLILCDLPYGVTANNKWDVVIPFDKLWKQYNRVIKDNGAIILTSQQPFTTKLINSNVNDFRYILIWDKVRPSGMLNANRMPMRQHEDILVFYKRLPVYNPQFTEKDIKNRRPNRVNNSIKREYTNSTNYVNTKVKFSKNFDDTKKHPTSIIKISNVNSFGKKRFHPTQKPVELMSWLIKTYTNEGDLVLDNCMGSGTTGVACKNLKRDFIGIELDKKYFEIAKERIENTTSNIDAKNHDKAYRSKNQNEVTNSD